MPAEAAMTVRALVPLALAFAISCGEDEPSDEDLIEKFIEDVGGPVDDAYVERALGYVDMARFPLDVRVPHHGGVYDGEKAPQLVAMFKDGMRRRFYDTEIDVRSSRYEIAGDRADLELALMTAVGPLRAHVRLRKTAPFVWKLSKVHVDR